MKRRLAPVSFAVREGAWLAAVTLVFSACSSPDGSNASTGGSTAVGTGGTATGGSPASTGGTPSTGGVPTTGGSLSGGSGGTNGGTPGSGGIVASGGVTAGASGSAGMTGTGGSVGGSGGAGSGGISGAGGTVGSGGSFGSAGGGAAGSSSTGGTVAGGGGKSGGGAGGQSGGGASGSAGTGGKGGAGGAGGAGGYNPCPTTAGTACIVLPLGDSITEGCCTTPYGGYRIELFRQALANRKSITFVGALTNGPDSVQGQSFPKRHEGHGGFTISGISGMITNNALTNYHPHIVLLMIGTNDINGNVDINNAPTRLGTLIDDITTRSPSSLVVVASIIPSRTDGTNQRFQAYNTSMRSLVAMRATAGKHVVFLDNYAAISKDANYKTALLADNLHPNDAGYVVLGQSFYGVIGGLLAAAP